MTVIRLQGRHYRTYPAEGYLGYRGGATRARSPTTAFLIVDVYGQFPEAGGAEQTGLEYMLGNEWDIVANRIRPAQGRGQAAQHPVCVCDQQRAADRAAALGLRDPARRERRTDARGAVRRVGQRSARVRGRQLDATSSTRT